MKEDFYISLLYKKLSGEIEPEEADELEKWITASSENKLIAEQIRIAWEESPALAAKPQVDLDQAFLELESKMDAPIPIMGKSKKLAMRSRWMQIAAAITFLLAAAFLLSDFLSPTVEFKEIVNSRDSDMELELEDGSQITLRPNSKLKHPTQFSEDLREVQLEGEAFFEVEHNASRPFIIRTPGEKVQVLGTKFRVQALPGSTESIVQVESGKVSFEANGVEGKLILEAGEKGIFDKSEKSFEEISASNPNEMSWATAKFLFEDTKLSDVFDIISDHYGIEIIAEIEDIECSLTASFEDESIQDILESISEIFDISFEKVSETSYTLKGGPCE
ncbi:MAG: FecR domain-containing protein [Bacteroidia bacterium]|nr:FecR domain-containing protein [Bacteroidia bacterium]